MHFKRSAAWKQKLYQLRDCALLTDGLMDMCQTCIDFSVNLPSLHSIPTPLQLRNLLLQQLLPVQVRIQSFAAQQFLVRSPFGNNPVFQHENGIGVRAIYSARACE